MADQKMPSKGKRVQHIGTLYGLVADDAPTTVRYVGFTTQKVSYRLNWHRNAITRPPRMPATAWIAELAARGVGIHSVVLKTGATYEDEVSEIARLRAAGADLLNKADGGPGTRGLEPTAAMRAVYAQPASDKQKAAARASRDKVDYGEVAQKNRQFYADDENRRLLGLKIAAALQERMTPERYAERSAKRRATMAKKKLLPTTE